MQRDSGSKVVCQWFEVQIPTSCKRCMLEVDTGADTFLLFLWAAWAMTWNTCSASSWVTPNCMDHFTCYPGEQSCHSERCYQAGELTKKTSKQKRSSELGSEQSMIEARGWLPRKELAEKEWRSWWTKGPSWLSTALLWQQHLTAYGAAIRSTALLLRI